MEINKIFDDSLDAVIVTDSEGVIVNVNKAAETLFGYSVEDLLSQNIEVLMPPKIAGVHKQYLSSYLGKENRGTVCFGKELPAKHKNGQTVNVLLTVCDSIVEGKHYFTGILRDSGNVDADSNPQDIMSRLCALDLSSNRNLERLRNYDG